MIYRLIEGALITNEVAERIDDRIISCKNISKEDRVVEQTGSSGVINTDFNRKHQ